MVLAFLVIFTLAMLSMRNLGGFDWVWQFGPLPG